jgi:hypothetical protein
MAGMPNNPTAIPGACQSPGRALRGPVLFFGGKGLFFPFIQGQEGGDDRGHPQAKKQDLLDLHRSLSSTENRSGIIAAGTLAVNVSSEKFPAGKCPPLAD